MFFCGLYFLTIFLLLFYILILRHELIDETIERRVSAMRSVVDLVRVLRERNSVPVKVRSFFLHH